VYIQEGQRASPSVRQPCARAAHTRRLDLPAPARQSGRRDPHHLRRQHHPAAQPAGDLLRAIGRNDRPRHRQRHRRLPEPHGRAVHPADFLLTVGFTYFYTAFTFKPDETADQLRKNGGFIPGIRPGSPTRDYLAKVVTRISLAGALFLGTVAVSPVIVGFLFQGSVLGSRPWRHGVADRRPVVVETMKQLEAQLMMRNYEGFIR
jgi:preprotein translocase subunit SecY